MKKIIGFLTLFLICFIASDQRISSQVSTNILGDPATNPIMHWQIYTPFGHTVNSVSMPPFLGKNLKSQEKKSRFMDIKITMLPYKGNCIENQERKSKYIDLSVMSRPFKDHRRPVNPIHLQH